MIFHETIEIFEKRKGGLFSTLFVLKYFEPFRPFFYNFKYSIVFSSKKTLSPKFPLCLFHPTLKFKFKIFKSPLSLFFTLFLPLFLFLNPQSCAEKENYNPFLFLFF